MNKILKRIDEGRYQESLAETKAFKNSRFIQETIGLEEIPDGLNEPLKNFRIISTRRLFKSSGWTTLLEVNPIHIESELGYSNSADAGSNWEILRGGTAAIVLPNDETFRKFVVELEESL
jgi:hypothetical protein